MNVTNIKRHPPYQQIVVEWEREHEHEAESLITLQSDHKGIRFEAGGIIKADLSLTVSINKNLTNVLLCFHLLNSTHIRKDLECQQFKFVECQIGIVDTMAINRVFDITSGDTLKVSVTGTMMIRQIQELNRLLVHYMYQ